MFKNKLKSKNWIKLKQKILRTQEKLLGGGGVVLILILLQADNMFHIVQCTT